jgi:hypothetical protein
VRLKPQLLQLGEGALQLGSIVEIDEEPIELDYPLSRPPPSRVIGLEGEIALSRRECEELLF